MPLIRKTPEKSGTSSDQPTDFTAGLNSTSPDARWAAARSAGGRPDAVPALASALAKEQDTRVREAIFTALARTATTDSAIAVVPYIRSDDAGLRAAALDSLRAMPEATKPQLPALLADADSDVRLLACDLVRDMRGSDAPKLLCDLIEADPQANVCAAAVEVLAEIGDATVLDSLALCAGRFPQDPFLAFAIKAASDRLRQRGDRG